MPKAEFLAKLKNTAITLLWYSRDIAVRLIVWQLYFLIKVTVFVSCFFRYNLPMLIFKSTNTIIN